MSAQKEAVTVSWVNPGVGSGVCFMGSDGRIRPALIQDIAIQGDLCLLVFPAAGEQFFASYGCDSQQMPYRTEWNVRHYDDPERKPHDNWWIEPERARPDGAR